MEKIKNAEATQSKLNNIEIWRDIPKSNGMYKISNFGRVKSLKGKKEKIIKPNKNRGGYLKIGLILNTGRKHISIHRLVASAFISNPNNLPEVNHIDGNKLNNNIKNLEWVTRKENSLHAYKIGLRKVSEKQKEASRNNIIIARNYNMKYHKNKRRDNYKSNNYGKRQEV